MNNFNKYGFINIVNVMRKRDAKRRSRYAQQAFSEFRSKYATFLLIPDRLWLVKT